MIEAIDDPTVVAGEVAEGVAQDAPVADDPSDDVALTSAPEEPPEEPTGQAYIAQRLESECNQLLRAINGLGVNINIDAVKQGAQVFAALRILVLAGIVTEPQVNIEVLLAERGALADILQQVEQQRLAAQKPQVAVARQPIQIARR